MTPERDLATTMLSTQIGLDDEFIWYTWKYVQDACASVPSPSAVITKELFCTY